MYHKTQPMAALTVSRLQSNICALLRNLPLIFIMVSTNAAINTSKNIVCGAKAPYPPDGNSALPFLLLTRNLPLAGFFISDSV